MKLSESLDKETFPVPGEVLNQPNRVALFADGACRGNPGPGAWAAVAQDEKGRILFSSSGVDVRTTNNKMELQGAIEALTQLKTFYEDGKARTVLEMNAFLYSDSKYVVEGMRSWVHAWKKRGWRKADNKVPENSELWKLLDEKIKDFQKVEFIWVKGHDGHPQNEYCDQLANEALDEAGF